MSRVGSAYSDYRLNLAPFEQDIQTILRRMQGVRTQVAAMSQGAAGSIGGGDSSAAISGINRLQQAQAALERQSGDLTAAEQRLQSVLSSQSATTTQSIAVQRQILSIQQQRSSQSLQLATAQARLQSSAGNLSAAERTLTQELANQSRITPQVVAAQGQLAQVQQRIAQGTSASVGALGQVRNALTSLTQAFGALGFAVGIGVMVNFARDAINSANQLQKAEATVRALSGSQERYNQVLNLARQGQRQYGGSLSDTLEGLGSLVNLSNRAGVSLKQLDNVSRRLSIVDPVQGIRGASIALKEFLTSADATGILSLVRRFELPRNALKFLSDETLTTVEKLNGLDRVLNEQGITMEVLTNRQNITAATYDRLGASVDNVKVSIGQLLAQGLEPAARVFDTMAIAVSNNLTALNSYSDKLKQVSDTVITSAGGYDEYSRKVGQVNAQLPIWGGHLQLLTPSQYAFAQSLIATGTSAQEATTRAQGLSEFAIMLDRQMESLKNTNAAAAQSLAEVNIQALTLASTSPEAQSAVQALLGAFARGAIDSTTLKIALDEMGLGMERVRQAALEEGHEQERLTGTHVTLANALSFTAEGARLNAAALVTQTEETLKSSIQTQQLAQMQELLASLGGMVAAGLMTSGQAALALAAQYNIAYKAALDLIQAQAALANAQAAQALGISKYSDSVQNMITGGRTPASVLASTKSADVAIANAKRERDAQVQADLAIARAKGQTKTEIDILRKSQQGLNKDSAEYKTIEAHIISLEKQKTGRGGGAGGAKITAAQKVNNQLEDQDTKFNQKMEDAAEKHEKRIADIEKRYQEQRLAAERKFKQQELDSRADFYESLDSIEDQGLRRVLSARYEEVQLEAQKVREKYGAQAAAEYESAARQAIEEETKLQDRINKLRSDKNEEGGKKTKDQRKADAAEAEYLEGVLKLKQAASAEKLRQIQEDGSSYEKDRQEAMQNEQEQYADAQNQIIESSDRATDKIVTNAERHKVAIDNVNTSLAKTKEGYDSIAPTTPTNGAAQPPAPQSAPITPTTPNQSGGDQMWSVRDQMVSDILVKTNDILTTGFTDVTIELKKLNVGIGKVETAVRASQSAVQ